MNILHSLVETPLAKTLGWTLFHFLWEGAAIAAALAVVLFLWRGASARLRYVLACAALLAMPVAFAVTFEVSLPSARPIALPARALSFATPAAIDAAAPTPSAPQPLRERLRWAAPFWMAGVLLFYVRSLGGWMAASRLRKRGVCAAPDEWQDRLRTLAARLRIARPVVLLESCLAGTPVVIGFVRPVILMPVGLLTGLTTDQVEAILIHELAHIRCYDYCVSLVQSVIEGLLFYHPAVWWISGLLRTERENCCDDIVVATSGDARGYAETLAHLERTRWSADEPALAATGGSLIRRIRRLLRQPEGPRAVAAPLFSAGLLLVSLAVALSAWPQQTTPPEAMRKQGERKQSGPANDLSAPPRDVSDAMRKLEKIRQGAESPYHKWLTEDVAYIISDQERAAFKNLQTDPEREHFIEQFWLRRDPTPGAIENEAKAEHYRRIAYSNERFAAATVAGWKTDRGRIYITYGPPDEIESHPAANPPDEQWLYHHLEGIGENVIVAFTDPTGLGEYHMTSDPRVAVSTTLPLAGPAPSVFVENLDWSAVPAGLRRPSNPAGRATMITVPIDAPSMTVYIRVTTMTGRSVANAEDRVENQSLYRVVMDLVPGAYRITVGTRPADSVATPATYTMTFEVR
jgi:GWxTD domain-containing protein